MKPPFSVRGLFIRQNGPSNAEAVPFTIVEKAARRRQAERTGQQPPFVVGIVSASSCTEVTEATEGEFWEQKRDSVLVRKIPSISR
jgi:hypothetical protein